MDPGEGNAKREHFRSKWSVSATGLARSGKKLLVYTTAAASLHQSAKFRNIITIYGVFLFDVIFIRGGNS
ncbi:hypothetical protein DLM86_04045 [Paenibacillus flagellatus]|uniref:Uncharacterized protein n=1 Tax=Paenibacillus flagellatus TaxID=2211139 RepID=A0A2V5K9J2_9BACL|nr:hypothetical protein DLM86_04045 [Paenibacillus flagellatus]